MTNAMDQIRILVCRTCPRYEQLPRAGAPTRGRELGHRLARALDAHDPDNRDVLRVVSCLAGCKNPCNVAIDGAGRFRLRFSNLEPDAAADVLTLAGKFEKSATGNLANDDLPDRLKDRLTAKSPPRLGN